MSPRIRYDRDMFGTEHRSVIEVLKLKEVRSLILDLRSRGAFDQTTELPCTWALIEYSVWFHLRLDLEGLTHYRELQWTKWIKCNRRRIAIRTIASVIKILSVKCPNPSCDEYFIEIFGILLSGVHFNHRLLKTKEMGQASNEGIDIFLDECEKGDVECDCAMCHGMVTYRQYYRRAFNAIKDDWIKPSLGLKLAKKSD